MYHVYSRSTDGKHQLTDQPLNKLDAKIFADEWLGKCATWQGTTRAISMYGDVLTIEEALEGTQR